MATSPGRAEAAEPIAVSMAVDVDLDEALASLSALGDRFIALVESIPNPDVRARGLEWTVAETAVHVWVAFDYYAACVRNEATIDAVRAKGESMPAFVARENRAQIDAQPERDPAKIAPALRNSLETFVTAATEAGPGHVVTFAAGYSEATTTSVCALICELMVHGDDIAQAIGARWDIDRAAAVLAAYSATAGLPLALDAEAAANEDIRAEIRLRGGAPFSIHIRDGRAWTEPGRASSPHVRVWADPAAFVMVGFGRTPLLRVLLRGRILAWGRRPWCMLKVPKLLLSP